MLPFVWKVKTDYMWDNKKTLLSFLGVELVRVDMWCQDCGTWKYWFRIGLK